MKKPPKPRKPTPESIEADKAFQAQLEQEAAFLRAWLDKYGWPIGEDPPHYENNIIQFPQKRK